MSKYLQIQVPKPCHENWDVMDAAKQGKYCNACQKTVIDFTLMTDSQLANFFKKPSENVCGRFNQQQLNTDILIPSRKIHWLKYFFQFAIPAFLFSSKVTAQKGKFAVTQKHVVNKKRVKSEIAPEAVNFNLNTTATCNSRTLQNDPLQSLNGSVGKTVITLGGVSIGRRIKEKKPISTLLLSRVNPFSVFPNPIISNSILNIKWNKTISSDQTVQIYNEQGTLLQNKFISFKKNNMQNELHLDQLPAGTYIIKITDNKTHRSSSQQFVVL